MRKADQKAALEDLKGLLLGLLDDVKRVKRDDLEAFANDLAMAAFEFAKQGYTRVPPELKAQALLLGEIARIRLNKVVKDRISTAMDVAVAILRRVL